jgi:SAM-dependent methyltransferase
MFPSLYHAHHSLHPEDLPFWLALADGQPGPLLELGCGSGRILIPLLEAGFQAYGLDNNEEMLRFLRRILPPGKQSAPPVFLADMAHFQLAMLFSLVILPCNTLSILSPDQRLSTLACVHHHLAPGGLFAASLPNPLILAEMPRRGPEEIEETFPHPVSGDPVQVSSAWRRSAHKFTVTWHYDCLLPAGQVERLTAQAAHSLEPAEAYFAALEGAGMRLTEIYGDFDRSPYTADSPYLVLVAKNAL